MKQVEKKLILASSSPRRAEILRMCGAEFTVDPAAINETIDLSGDLQREIEKLSIRKARAVQCRHKEDVIIGSDTIVVLNHEVLGKPRDAKEAERMMRALSGHTHQVITGVCILQKEDVWSRVSTSHVTFGPVSEREIEAYVKSREPYDKAGAYAIQGSAARFISHIDGDFYSIMGLPLHLVYEHLKQIGMIGI